MQKLTLDSVRVDRSASASDYLLAFDLCSIRIPYAAKNASIKEN